MLTKRSVCLLLALLLGIIVTFASSVAVWKLSLLVGMPAFLAGALGIFGGIFSLCVSAYVGAEQLEEIERRKRQRMREEEKRLRLTHLKRHLGTQTDD